jgi:hypothetical protein
MALTATQKDDLVSALLAQAGNLLEFPDLLPESLQGDLDAVGAQLTTWLKRLPGTGWDARLPHPNA